MAFSGQLRVLPSGRGVALRALEDGAPVHVVAVSGPLPTITINGLAATIHPPFPHWHSDGSFVSYFIQETIAPTDVVLFTDGGGGLPVIGAEQVAYMDPSANGWRGSHSTILIGAPSSDVRRRATFTVPESGSYKVSLTWPHWGDAATNAEFKIWDGGTLRATVQVNQLVQPNDFLENGAWWEDVWTGSVTSGTLKVELTTNVTSARISFDGVRAQLVGGGQTYIQYADDVAGAGSVAYEVDGGSLPTFTAAAVDTSRIGLAVADVAPPSPPTMRVGLMLMSSGAWTDPIFMNANLTLGTTDTNNATQCDANGLPTGTTVRALASSLTSNVYDSRGFAAAEPGSWTVRYDGSGSIDLFDSTTEEYPIRSGDKADIALIAETITGGAGNVRTFDVDFAAQNTGWDLNVSMIKTGAITRWAVYPPGVPADGSSRWQPGPLAQIGHFTFIRNMGFCVVNGSNIRHRTDFSQRTDASYAWKAQTVRQVAITSIGDYAPNDLWIAAHSQRFKVTTSVAHGLTSGDVIRLDTSDASPIVIGMTGGTTLDLRNARVTVMVTSATEFAARMDAGTHLTVATPYAGAVAFVDVNKISGQPFEDFLELCELCDCEPHVCVPPLATDACVTAMAAETMALLIAHPEWKVLVEYANEAWNSLQDMAHRTYIMAMGNIEGLYSAGASMQTMTIRWYCKRMSQVRALWRAAAVAAGVDPDRVVMALGGWWALTDRTQEMAAYCAAQGYTFERLVLAPYTTLGGSDNVDFSHDLLNAPQCVDLVELHMADFRVYAAGIHAAHRAALDANGFAAVQISAYEGSPEGLSRATNATTNGKQALAVYFHSRYRHVITAYLDIFNDLGWTDFCYFGHFYKIAPQLIDGFTYQAVAWMAYLATNMTPGRGDGTDAKFDNNAVIGTGVPPNLPELDDFVSTAGEAMRVWNAALDAPTTNPIANHYARLPRLWANRRRRRPAFAVRRRRR